MLNDVSLGAAEDFISAAWAGGLASADTGLTLKCGCTSCLKSAGYKFGPDGLLPPDGVGGDLKNVNTQVPLNTLDVAGSNSIETTQSVVTVDGPSVIATIDTIGDRDFYRVELVAGQAYNIGMYLYTGGSPLNGQSGVPLADAYIELYDSTGKLLIQADGGGPNTPQGLDALLTFVAEESGVYYINAQSFDQDGTNGTQGDGVGDYELFVQTTEAPDVFRYDIDSPLHSIDWGGATITNTSRNPDGAEGPRPTGFEQSPGGLTGGGPDGGDKGSTGDVQAIAGKNVITYYFAKVGDVFLSQDPTTPGVTADIVQAREITAYERAAYRSTFDQYEKVADVVYVEVDNVEDAYFKIITYNGTPGPGASLLGRASPPGEESEGQMEYNAGDERYNEAGLTQGGFFYQTLLHEVGHAHGLAHPHDTGGGSSVMRGGGGGTGGIGGGFGDFDLSQQVFTIMSYNDGWSKSPYGQADDGADYGWVGTLSPLDIAVIQDKYGVNETYRAGNDTYVLKDVNAKGTFYESIWDAGGVDTMRYDGARATVIDLRAATLKYEEGGGGRVSYADGIFGGFTIANGVLIENAVGGSGADTITGNNAANRLTGNAGDDKLFGGFGADILSGGAGNDSLAGAADADRLTGDAGLDRLDGGAGNDVLDGGLDNDVLFGRDGADVLQGGAGLDTLLGGAGRDVLRGGADSVRDTFRFDLASESTAGRAGMDLIADFKSGVDKIDLRGLRIADFDEQVQISGKPGNSFVLVDLDRDGQFDDFGVQVQGTAPVEGDFLI